MTTADMLAAVRTILDETTQSYFQDSAIYKALQSGQIEAINLIYSIYKAKKDTTLPDALIPVSQVKSGTASSVTTISVPTDLLFLIGAEVTISGTLKPAYQRNFDIRTIFYKYNSLMNNTSDVTYYPVGTNLQFNQTLNGAYNIYYIQNPATIVAGVDPVIGLSVHDAIVYYAVAFMLLQDQRSDESAQNFSKFMLLITKYMGL